jgi:hypothetical protein
MPSFLTGTHPKHGKLWAAIDPDAHHLTGRVCERRFGAFCAPFRSEAEGAEALIEAGATLDVRKVT